MLFFLLKRLQQEELDHIRDEVLRYTSTGMSIC